MKRLFALIKRLYYNKKIRFLFVGGLNTLIGFGSNALFLYLGMNYRWALTCATIIGVINSYFWNKYFTFKRKKKSTEEIIKFILVYLASFFLNLGLQYVMIERNGINEYLSILIGLVTTTLLSYFGHNFFSFRQKRNEDESLEKAHNTLDIGGGIADNNYYAVGDDGKNVKNEDGAD